MCGNEKKGLFSTPEVFSSCVWLRVRWKCVQLFLERLTDFGSQWTGLRACGGRAADTDRPVFLP